VVTKSKWDKRGSLGVQTTYEMPTQSAPFSVVMELKSCHR